MMADYLKMDVNEIDFSAKTNSAYVMKTTPIVSKRLVDVPQNTDGKMNTPILLKQLIWEHGHSLRSISLNVLNARK